MTLVVERFTAVGLDEESAVVDVRGSPCKEAACNSHMVLCRQTVKPAHGVARVPLGKPIGIIGIDNKAGREHFGKHHHIG